MTDTLYSVEALSTGTGRRGHVTTTDGAVSFTMAPPTPLGGSGDGYNPEQLFAAGYAACYHSALHAVARAEKLQLVDSSVGTRVSLAKDANGDIGLAVRIEVVLPDLDNETAQRLADAAHALCPYSRATKGNIEVSITVADD